MPGTEHEAHRADEPDLPATSLRDSFQVMPQDAREQLAGRSRQQGEGTPEQT